MTEHRDEVQATAESAAAAAREQGITLIRNHLEAHLEQNPGSSYVTWIATLHPENASVVVDERFLVPGNAWWAVYEETREPIKTVVAEPITPAAATPVLYTSDAGSSTTSIMAATNKQPHKSLLDLLVGTPLLISGILVTFSMEVASTAIFVAEYCFEWLCDTLTLTPLTSILYGPFWLTKQILHLVGWILLLTSTLVVEVLAGTALLVCSLLALDVGVGRSWHQHIRRTSHVTRWAYREPFSAWKNRSETMAAANHQTFPEAIPEARQVHQIINAADVVVVEVEPDYKN